MTSNDAEQAGSGRPDFTSPDGLHALLERLHQAGPGAWQQDADATALLHHTIEKYRRLARKWHREPADAGYAAFMAMQSAAVLDAEDPWGFVTRAVQRNIMSETMGDRLMISSTRARKSDASALEAPTRAGDRDWLYDYTPTAHPLEEPDNDAQRPELQRLRDAMTDIVDLLIGLGWPERATATAVEYVLSRTGDAGSLKNAREILRRETDMPARLGLPANSWPGLLRVLLGGKSRPGRPTHRGVLVRLVHYDTIETLLEDDELLVQIALAAPTSGNADG